MGSTTIIKDRKTITFKQKAITAALLVFMLLLAMSAIWYDQGGKYILFPAMEEARIQTLIDEQLAEYIQNPSPFVFTVVPNATSTLKMPPPEEEDISLITKDYLEARAALPRELPVVPSSIKQFVVGDMPYEEFLNALPEPQRTNWFQIHDEVRVLVEHFNNLYKVSSVLTLIGTSTPLLYPDDLFVYGSDRPLTYPSLRVVEGYVTSGLLSRLFPDLATDFEVMAVAYATEGVAYGHYSYQDLSLAKQLALDYLALVPDSMIVGTGVIE